MRGVASIRRIAISCALAAALMLAGGCGGSSGTTSNPNDGSGGGAKFTDTPNDTPAFAVTGSAGRAARASAGIRLRMMVRIRVYSSAHTLSAIG